MKTNKSLQNESAELRSKSQQLFTRYTLAVLIDLTVLNLFNEYWDYVYIESFTIALFAALLLQFFLQVTIKIEHRVAVYITAKSELRAKVRRFLSAWGIIFTSKVVMLEAINYLFGEGVLFSGPIHGLVAFIIVVTAIIVVEQAFTRIYQSLA